MEANVNFIKVIDNKSLYLRTFERGVEVETNACGSGPVSSTNIIQNKMEIE